MSCEAGPSRGWVRQAKVMPQLEFNNGKYGFRINNSRDLDFISSTSREFDSLSKEGKRQWQERVAEIGLTRHLEEIHEESMTAPESEPSLAEELFSGVTQPFFEALKVLVSSKSSR